MHYVLIVSRNQTATINVVTGTIRKRFLYVKVFIRQFPTDSCCRKSPSKSYRVRVQLERADIPNSNHRKLRFIYWVDFESKFEKSFYKQQKVFDALISLGVIVKEPYYLPLTTNTTM